MTNICKYQRANDAFTRSYSFFSVYRNNRNNSFYIFTLVVYRQQKVSILQQYYYKTNHSSADPHKALQDFREKIFRSVYTILYQKWLKYQESYPLSKEPRHKLKTQNYENISVHN